MNSPASFGFEEPHEKRRDHSRRRVALLKTPVDALSWDALLARISRWATRGESRYICFCGIHALLQGYRDAEFRRAIENADTAAPDGLAIMRLMRRRGVILQEHINRRMLLWRCAERLASEGTPIFLYGASDFALRKSAAMLQRRCPTALIAGYSSETHEDSIVEQIIQSGAGVVFVGLSSPEQELWMARISWRIPAVLVGVGDALHFKGRLRSIPPQFLHRESDPAIVRKHEPLDHARFLYYALREQLTIKNDTALRLR